MPRERVLASAEGRIWTGRQGLERGLVDRLGGIGTALAMAREQAHLEDDVAIVEWPPRRTVLETILETMNGGDPAEDAASAMLELELGEAVGAVRWMRLLRGREHVVVALPVGLSIR